MLRNQSQKNAKSNSFNGIGFGGEKLAIDEVEVLQSSSLMEQVVDHLNLQTLYYQRAGFYWKSLYPSRPFTLVLPAGCPNVIAVLTVDKDKYVLSVEDAFGEESETSITDLKQPFKTHIGNVFVSASSAIDDGRYRIIYNTTEWAVQDFCNRVSVSRSSRESRIIHLAATTSEDTLMRDVLEDMLAIYYRESVADKNLLASQIELFLKDRVVEVAGEMDSTEAVLEAYKRAYRIANLDAAAESYRTNSEHYDQRAAQLDADLAILDFITQQLNAMGDDYTVLPSNMGISDGAISELVLLYNSLVLTREKLLQTAMSGNPKLDSHTAQLDHTRIELLSAIEKSRQSTLLIRENVRKQRDLYASRLQSTPEQERRYQEMLRERKLKEKQYNFLVESLEENALLLASDVMPVRIIERPTIYPMLVSPNLFHIMPRFILLGLLLPIAWFLLVTWLSLLRSTLAESSNPAVSDSDKAKSE